MLDYTGLTLEDVKAEDFRRRRSIRKMWRGSGTNAGRRFHAVTRLKWNNESAEDGQYRWVLVRYNPFRDEEGNIIRWYATGTDIEDRKRAEERVQTKTWRCAKKSITRGCSRRSSGPQKPCVGCSCKSPKSHPRIPRFSSWVKLEPAKN